MKCTRVEKFLPLHAAGDLSGRRRRRAVEKHLATCAKCRLAADEYHASRELLRAAALHLAPDFDSAFYDEIRHSVLARIGRDRRAGLATPPPPAARFPRLLDVRLACAASLALVIFAAALALHAYQRRTSEEGVRRDIMAIANHEPPATVRTPRAASPGGDDDRPTPPPSLARGTTKTGRRRAGESSLPKLKANAAVAQNGSPAGLHPTSRAPSTAGRNSPSLAAAATPQTNARETAGEGASGGGGGATAAAATATEVSRIEMQTSDPNIRIIWLSPNPEDPARPLK